jgi:RHH-type proline utilization regulon transcriptional repressor/proline dehydrogenase/delta 1-pyrroline-5-carboxylate dehydrogenase
VSSFGNEPLLELRRASIRESMLEAMAGLDERLPLDVPVLIGGDRVAGEAFSSEDPCDPARVVAVANGASPAQVEQALASAELGSRSWGSLGAVARADTLSRAAGILRGQRLELAALAVRECAKPWVEADAEVCEAIDFIEYYAREAIELDGGVALEQRPGERNRLRYAPRGTVAVIAPWNFPLAIVAGMTSAALAAGNAVVLKPAAQAPACAARIVEAFHRAGVPLDALALLPGGDEIGSALVGHASVHAVAFTGSCAAGLDILERAARVAPGQRHIKRVVAEMGGKNCILVDADADLDEAVPAILTSAFGFAGQKCSAASRVLAHEAIAGVLRDRLAGAMASIQVGDAADFTTDVPAVIDSASRERVLRYAEIGRATGALVAASDDVPTSGHYVAPAIFAELPPDSPLVEEEIFGPILSYEVVPDIAAACAGLERSPFALTAGLFSRSPATIDYVIEHVPVGNLYVNREITGAMVARQPFGGHRLSGTGAKAGGPGYLLNFMESFVVTENTMRHGLVL